MSQPSTNRNGFGFPKPQRRLFLEKAASLLLAAAAAGCTSLPAAVQPELPPPLPLLAPPDGAQTLFIRQYRVVGSKVLPRTEVDDAVYGYLGPGRTEEDVEQARTALEKAYKDKGFKTVSVSVPRQSAARGIVILVVTEAPVGRLRVQGSRFFNIDQIKNRAPSLKEGTVPNFNEVEREIIALNQSADLQVTPSLKPGAVPGTVDVELTVKDKLPLHGSVELNNRYSANTTPLRINFDLRYSNLWQLGHTIGFGFQVAPQRPDDALVYSAYYIAPVPGVNWLSVMLQGIRQNSNVSTLGGTAVAGNGEIYGGRFLFDLPGGKGFYHSASFGLDYKHFTQDLSLGDQLVGSPITYWPFVTSYNAALIGKGRVTELSTALTFHFRGMGSTTTEFDNRRYNADGNFVALRGTLGHEQDLPFGFQFYGLLQGQASPNPLVDSEQFSLGGLNTVRGYLESVVLGDSAVAGTVELRSPSLLGWLGEGHEWRVFGFLDAGASFVNDPLPEQTAQSNVWSYGVGSNLRILDHLNGAIVLGVPMISQTPSVAGEPLLTFRIWGEL
ncbi:MAG: ShlB/FhaC/HecB family hemolysin secretion/activation protein [Verrucomicrobiota bacterium]